MSKLHFPAAYARIIWDEDTLIKWVGGNFAWSGRDDYLEWVIDWKAALRERIVEIRRLKAVRRDKAQASEDRMSANDKRQAIRIECRNLLLLRQMGKAASVEQRGARQLAA